MAKRSQVAMEYMMVVGFAMLMVIPLFVIYGSQGMAARDQVNEKQASNIARKIVDSAETVYYLGKPSKTTIKVYMPDDIRNITISPRSIDFHMRTSQGVSVISVESSYVNLTGSLSANPGIHYIEIAADDYAVNVSTRS